VNISEIKGYELSATIPAIAQAMYGKYNTWLVLIPEISLNVRN